jgi:hypothetical protein
VLLWSYICVYVTGSDWFQYDGVPDFRFALTSLDFNFWSYTKDLVYEVEINTEGQLRERIADAANQIRNNPEMLNSVYENWYLPAYLVKCV